MVLRSREKKIGISSFYLAEVGSGGGVQLLDVNGAAWRSNRKDIMISVFCFLCFQGGVGAGAGWQMKKDAASWEGGKEGAAAAAAATPAAAANAHQGGWAARGCSCRHKHSPVNHVERPAQAEDDLSAWEWERNNMSKLFKLYFFGGGKGRAAGLQELLPN